MAVGYNYLRPHETHHEPSRRFYPNEILRAPIHEAIDIDLIHGHCWVVDTATYCKGRPKGKNTEAYLLMQDAINTDMWAQAENKYCAFQVV